MRGFKTRFRSCCGCWCAAAAATCSPKRSSCWFCGISSRCFVGSSRAASNQRIAGRTLTLAPDKRKEKTITADPSSPPSAEATRLLAPLQGIVPALPVRTEGRPRQPMGLVGTFRPHATSCKPIRGRGSRRDARRRWHRGCAPRRARGRRSNRSPRREAVASRTWSHRGASCTSAR